MSTVSYPCARVGCSTGTLAGVLLLEGYETMEPLTRICVGGLPKSIEGLHALSGQAPVNEHPDVQEELRPEVEHAIQSGSILN